jgi:flagellar protein FliS
MYNNNRKNAVDKYKHQSIMTASPEELTLMLYNECLKCISHGRDSIEKKDIPGKNEALKKAQKIIKHLDGTLDMNIPISKDFKKMYDYIQTLLVEGNIRKDIEKLDQAYGLVVEFRDTWHQAMKKAAIEGVPSAI